uniref:Uncharacterized protein n=1 Tax=Rhizophora mucronata TaxID=61149 RepID=A0A2P2N8C4_RHIMU
MYCLFYLTNLYLEFHGSIMDWQEDKDMTPCNLMKVGIA